MYIESVDSKELRKRRKKMNLTQEELGEKLGVSGNTVARWERELNPIPSYLELALESIERQSISSNNVEILASHKSALVPLATGYFQSPELFVKGQVADTGLLAESLIYYDVVYAHVDNPEQFAGLISLLIQQGLSYEKLTELVEEGVLRFYNTVWIMPFMGYGRNDMVSSLWAIREEAMNQPDYFSKKFLEFQGLKSSFSTFSNFNKKYFDRFRKAAEKTAISLTNEDVTAGVINNAYDDFLNPKRNVLIVKNLLKEVYKANNFKKSPFVRVKIQEVSSNYHQVAQNLNSYVVGRNLDNDEYKIYEVEYNSDLINNLKILENTKTPLVRGLSTLPLSQSGMSNLIIRSAERLNSDLFLASPISKTIGDKLYEIGEFEKQQKQIKISEIVENLETEVEFPDLRRYVNEGKIEFDKVLEIRKKAKQFREWLQIETDRDRNAIIAYHNEVAKETGFTKIGKTTLKMFGVLASVGLSIGAEAYFKDQDTFTKESVKKVGSKIVESATDKISKKLFQEWKPVCFGDWYREEIKQLLKQSD
jgi:transcriptional regulator with XRE-family HTH domain